MQHELLVNKLFQIALIKLYRQITLSVLEVNGQAYIIVQKTSDIVWSSDCRDQQGKMKHFSRL